MPVPDLSLRLVEAMASINEASGRGLLVIAGAGGGSIAGALTAIALTDRPLFIFLAMLVFTVIGGVIPLSGVCAAVGGFLAIVLSRIIGPHQAVGWWPVFTIAGVFVGFAHVLGKVLWHRAFPTGKRSSSEGRLANHQQLHVLVSEGRWYWPRIGVLCLSLGPLMGAIVGAFIGGPPFICECAAIGAIVGLGLFLGVVAAAFVASRGSKRGR
jgi:hypothetical protein